MHYFGVVRKPDERTNERNIGGKFEKVTNGRMKHTKNRDIHTYTPKAVV